MKARVDMRRTAHGWEVARWQIGGRPWCDGPPADAYLTEATREGFPPPTVNGENVLVPVARRGYWNGDTGPDLPDARFVRIELNYPLPMHGAHRCQSEWNDRTLTKTGCERMAVGRFYRTDAALRKRKVWLCATCGAKEATR